LHLEKPKEYYCIYLLNVLLQSLSPHQYKGFYASLIKKEKIPKVTIENLKIHLAYMGKTNSDIVSVLSSVGLNNINEQPVSTFSLGMRQRLAIARAIIHKPKLLILDEPINGLDPVGIKEIRDLFIELVKNQNMTLLISSHILTEIEHIADTIGVIVNGTIVKEVSMTKIKAECPSGLEDYFIDIMNGGENK